jgi:dihydroneopterin aldolase
VIYTINLAGLKVHAYHGVLPHETAYGQEFLIDCNYLVEAQSEDELTSTVSYAAIADLLVITATSNTYQLLETLANQLLAAVLAHSPKIIRVMITVHKPMAPIDHEFQDVSVSVSGDRGDD